MKSLFAGLGLVLGVCLAAVPTARSLDAAGADQAAATRTVYVSAVDDKGLPVKDITVADLAVKEDGKAREIVKVSRAEAPMRIAIIIDDNGSGIFRAGLVKFLQATLSQAEVSLTLVQTQAQKLTGFTRDPAQLTAAINQLGPRPETPDGGQLLEAIAEAAKFFNQQKAERPIILVLSVGGEEHSSIRSNVVMDSMQKAGAALHVVMLPASVIRQNAAPTNPGSMLEENMNLGQVLGDGPKQTGGRYVEAVASTGLFDGLQQIGEELMQQYAVVYARAADSKPNSRFQIETKRKGVKLRAPQQVVDR
jgi:VWFA-related protein